MIVVVKDGKLEVVRTTSPQQAVVSLKTLGVKGLDKKREAAKLKAAGTYTYSGVGGCEVVVSVR